MPAMNVPVSMPNLGALTGKPSGIFAKKVLGYGNLIGSIRKPVAPSGRV
jgi:hypothetical protein